MNPQETTSEHQFQLHSSLVDLCVGSHKQLYQSQHMQDAQNLLLQDLVLALLRQRKSQLKFVLILCSLSSLLHTKLKDRSNSSGNEPYPNRHCAILPWCPLICHSRISCSSVGGNLITQNLYTVLSAPPLPEQGVLVVVKLEHHGLLDDGFGFVSAVTNFVNGYEDLLFYLVVVYADEVAEVGA